MQVRLLCSTQKQTDLCRPRDANSLTPYTCDLGYNITMTVEPHVDKGLTFFGKADS
jgi:hypothetical protein